MKPRARIHDLRVVEHEGGLFIHDLQRGVEHSLHPLTACVWKHADGETTVAEIGDRVRDVLGPDVTDEHVWAAVDVLTGADLLEARIAPPAATERVHRRDLLRRVATGTVAAAAVGAIAAGKAEAAPEASKESAQKLASEQAQKLAARHAEQDQKRDAREDASKASREEAQKARAAQEDASKAAHENAEKMRAHLNPLDLAAGWSEYGQGYALAGYRVSGGFCALSGVLIGAEPGLIGTLPPHARPRGGRHVTSANSHDHVCRIDILPDGSIVLVSGIPRGWLSLSGIVFPVGIVAGEDVPAGTTGEDPDQEQSSKESASKEEDAKTAQERQEKVDAEQAAKEESDKEQTAKTAQEQKAKLAEQKSKSQEQAQKAAQEQADKAAQEQADKLAQEQVDKEATAKHAQEQKSKEVDAKHAEQSAKQAQEQAAKEQAAKTGL